MKKAKKRTGKSIWMYIDGKRICDAVEAALDNHMFIDDLKKKLIAENPGHEVTFKIE